MAVEIQIKNYDVIRDLVGKFPRVAATHVGKAIGLSLSAIQGNAKIEAPYGVSALLKNHWLQSVAGLEGALRSGQEYATDVHEGTPPHHVPADELKKWAAKKGLNPYAVSKSIAKKGTKANPFLKRAAGKTADAIDRFFAAAGDSITKELGRGGGGVVKF